MAHEYNATPFIKFIEKMYHSGLSDQEIHEQAKAKYPIACSMHTNNALQNIRKAEALKGD